MINSRKDKKQPDAKENISLFNILYKTHKQAVYGYICYLTRNKHDAEDIFQETWLRVVRKLDQVNDLESSKAWLYTIATNLYKDLLRKKKHRLIFWEKKKIQYAAENPKNLLEISVQAERMEQKEIGRSIVNAIEKLPEKLRRIFILKQVEDFSYLEISAILNLPVGTAKSRMFRAIKILRQELTGINPACIP